MVNKDVNCGSGKMSTNCGGLKTASEKLHFLLLSTLTCRRTTQVRSIFGGTVILIDLRRSVVRDWQCNWLHLCNMNNSCGQTSTCPCYSRSAISRYSKNTKRKYIFLSDSRKVPFSSATCKKSLRQWRINQHNALVVYTQCLLHFYWPT